MNLLIDPFSISWHEPSLNPSSLTSDNVLDYFCDKSNPFYSRTSNNEVIRMQCLTTSVFTHEDQHNQLISMTGLEFFLLHAQPPILFVIRQQTRHSPTSVTPIADFYILAGVVYRAPDLKRVLSSRLQSAFYFLNQAFTDTLSYVKFQLSDSSESNQFTTKRSEVQLKNENNVTSDFQRERVDTLIDDILKKFSSSPVAINASFTQNQSKLTDNSESNLSG